jgi:transposase
LHYFAPLRLQRRLFKPVGKGMNMSKLKIKKKSKKFKAADLPVELKHVNLDAAGIDVGSDRHMVAVPAGRDESTVREFGAFTADLQALADWLKKCGVTTIAMESTGVYWIPLFEILEQRGFEVKLVDARKSKNVSGRKSDVLDCQWLQTLHTYGLLTGAFRPADEICVLRGYMRQKEMLVQSSSMHIQHMQKALQQMNLLLHNVVTDITGVTGMTILKAIIAGERDAKVLASHRDPHCRNSVQTIAKSLVGNYREEHVFALTQAVELYEFYQSKINACELAITRFLATPAQQTEDEPPASQKNIPPRHRMRAGVDLRSRLFKLTGVDLFSIPGLGTDTLLTILAEVGFDMTPWKTEKHFASWLALCSGTRISGGKVLDRKTKRSNNRAAQAFRLAASSLARSNTALGAFYRRIRARIGAPQAVTATAHKIAITFYSLLKNRTTYLEIGESAYEQKFKERRIKAMQKQALAMGYQLIPAA